MQKQVTLGPGGSRTVSFAVAPMAAETYQVSVNDLTGIFKAVALEDMFCMTRFVHELEDKDLRITEAFGRIGNLSVSRTKYGASGVEATFIFATDNARIAVEVLGWYEYGNCVTGVTIYDYNKTPNLQYNKTVKLTNPMEMLSYEVMGHPAVGIHTVIRDSAGTKIFDDMYNCLTTKIIRFQTELEYWRRAEEGYYNFDGTIILDRGYGSTVGYINLGDACSFYKDTFEPNYPCLEFHNYEHYASEGSWILKGRIRDP